MPVSESKMSDIGSTERRKPSIIVIVMLIGLALASAILAIYFGTKKHEQFSPAPYVEMEGGGARVYLNPHCACSLKRSDTECSAG